MLRHFRIATCRFVLTICIFISCIILFTQLLSTSFLKNEQIIHHKSTVYMVSDSLVLKNLIDQFLQTKYYHERDDLWFLLVQRWLKSFKTYLERTKMECPSPSSPSFDFIHQYLNEYTKKVLLNNLTYQRRLTGFGLFYDYNPNEIRLKTDRIFSNVYPSSCIYFELIILIMKVQLVLSELNIDYSIGENTLLGALRHHDIVPWHSIVEFNLPLNSQQTLLRNMNQTFLLEFQQVNDTYVNETQIGFIYKIFIKDKIWPQIEIHFSEENLIDIFPLHLRPFGPLLLLSSHNHQAMISIRNSNICESLSWNHQLGEEININHQWRLPCQQLHTVYSFVQTRYNWRQGYCEETLQTNRLPYRTLSYFRYSCQENRTYQLR